MDHTCPCGVLWICRGTTCDGVTAAPCPGCQVEASGGRMYHHEATELDLLRSVARLTARETPFVSGGTYPRWDAVKRLLAAWRS